MFLATNSSGAHPPEIATLSVTGSMAHKPRVIYFDQSAERIGTKASKATLTLFIIRGWVSLYLFGLFLTQFRKSLIHSFIYLFGEIKPWTMLLLFSGSLLMFSVFLSLFCLLFLPLLGLTMLGLVPHIRDSALFSKCQNQICSFFFHLRVLSKIKGGILKVGKYEYLSTPRF